MRHRLFAVSWSAVGSRRAAPPACVDERRDMLVTMTSPHQPHRVPGGAAPPQFPGQATPYPAGQQQAGDGDWGAATPAVPHVYGPGPVPSAYGQPAYPPAYPPRRVAAR